MENDLRGIENYFELTGGSSYRGFMLPGVDFIRSRGMLNSPLALILLGTTRLHNYTNYGLRFPNRTAPED